MAIETECYLMDENGEWHFAVISETEYARRAKNMSAMSEGEYFAWLTALPNVEIMDRGTAEIRGSDEDSGLSFEAAVASEDNN